MSSVLQHYSFLFEKVHTASGSIDHTKTLAAWKKRAMTTRNALMQVREEHLKERAKIERDFKGEALRTRLKDLDDDYRTVEKIALDRANRDLDEVLDSKRKALEGAQKPPTEAMLRLLTAANMRTSLSPSEIVSMSGQLAGNLPALALLHDIAAKHKIAFPDVSVERIEDNLKNAENFARERLSTMGQPLEDMAYKTRLFWASDSGEARYFFDSVDNGVTAALKAENINSAAQSDEGKTPNCIRVTLTGHESLFGVANQFSTSITAIRDLNPNTDFSRNFAAGQQILVPGSKMKIINSPTAVKPDACTPAYSELIAQDNGQNKQDVTNS